MDSDVAMCGNDETLCVGGWLASLMTGPSFCHWFEAWDLVDWGTQSLTLCLRSLIPFIRWQHPSTTPIGREVIAIWLPSSSLMYSKTLVAWPGHPAA